MKKNIFILLLFLPLIIFSQDTRDIKFELLNFSDKNYNDYAPTLYKDGIIFTSDRNSENNFYSLYFSDLKSSPQLIKVKNNKYHIGPAYYDKQNDIIYFTKSSNIKSKISSNEYQIKLAVYEGLLRHNEIFERKKLNFCNPNYNYGHPQIYEKKLLISFADSNNNYSLNIYGLENNNWKKLKSVYRTKYLIMFPSFLNDNTIVFSAKIKGGKGGLDLYKIIKKDGKWSKPINLKEFNSKYDDFSLLYINEYEGYISSNRIDKKDHIFKFTIEH